MKYCIYNSSSDAYLRLIELQPNLKYYWVRQFRIEHGADDPSIFNAKIEHGIDYVAEAIYEQIKDMDMVNELWIVRVHEPSHPFFDEYPLFEDSSPLRSFINIGNEKS